MHTIAEIGTNVPAFLGKLWKMVEDPITNDLISWSSSGSSFVIHDGIRFARELLPMYYKHNNMASFIRQLNMYGFHKIVSVDAGNLKQEYDEIKFTHPFFVRGHPYLLDHIKRKMTANKMSLAPSEKNNNVMTKVLSDVRQMKGRQETMDSRLAGMKMENEALWRELSVLRQKHLKQRQIVNKLIQFLVTIVQPGHNLGVKRRSTPLMLRDKANRSPSMKPSPTGPVIHELGPADVLLEDVLPEDEDNVLDEAETILPDAGPEDSEPLTTSNYFSVEDVENDVILPDSVVDSVEDENIGLENLPTQFLTVDVDPLEYRTIIGNKVINSPVSQQPSPVVAPNNKRQTAPATSKRKSRATKSCKRRKISSGNEGNNTYVYSSVDSSSQQPVENNLQINSNEKYPTVVIDVPVNNINNIRMIFPQQPNGRKIQPSEEASTLLTGKNVNDNNLIEEEPPPTPVILDDLTAADILLQSPTPDVASSTTPSPPIVNNIDLGAVTQTELPNGGVCSPSANSELGLQIARMDPTKNTSQLNNCWGQRQNKEVLMANGNWCGGKNRSEMDSHVESVQSDLDSLKELLRNEGLSLDANALLGIFNSDDALNYLVNDSVPDSGKFKDAPAGNEVITYNPALFDLADMLNGNDWSLPDSSGIDDPATENDDAGDISFSEINTPQFVLNSPSFPIPAKKRKK